MAGKYILYEHRNKINGKRYIGITNNKTKRWCGRSEKRASVKNISLLSRQKNPHPRIKVGICGG